MNGQWVALAGQVLDDSQLIVLQTFVFDELVHEIRGFRRVIERKEDRSLVEFIYIPDLRVTA